MARGSRVTGGDGEASTRQRRGKKDAKSIGCGVAGGRDNEAINKRKQIIDKFYCTSILWKDLKCVVVRRRHRRRPSVPIEFPRKYIIYNNYVTNV